MLYAYIGTDRKRSRAALNRDSEASAKKDEAHMLRITEHFGATEAIEHALARGGLFTAKYVVVLDEVFSSAEDQTDAEVFLPRIADAVTPFFLLEEKPNAAYKKLIKKHAESVQEFDLPRQERDWSSFTLADAFLRKDKKGTWVGYIRALQKGNAPEAIHGALFWKVKDAILKGRNTPELQKIAADLAVLPHEARRRGVELELALEHYLLR